MPKNARFEGPGLTFLSPGCVLISYSAECNAQKLYKTLMFLGQAGTFLSFQARRSSAMRSSTSDLTVDAF